MKIALLAHSLLSGKGGAERVAAQVGNLLARDGAAVYLFCDAREIRSPRYPMDDSVEIVAVPFRQKQAWLKFRGESFDLAVGFGMANFFIRIPEIAETLNVPFAIQECTNPIRMAEILTNELIISAADAFWLRQAVFAHAAAVRFTVPDYLNSVVRDVQPFAYGFYNSLTLPERPPGGFTATRKFICVGAMKDENKNGLAAIRAFCSAWAPGSEWSLHLYGRNRFQAELAELKGRYPLAEIIDHGIVDNEVEMYRDAHALIIPSFDEGLPNVVVEAFSYGIPCVGFSDCLGVRELIKHEETGLLANREDPGSLERCLGRLMDPDVRANLGKTAETFALNHLGYDLWAEQWVRMVENAIGGKNRDGDKQIPAAFDACNTRSRHWRSLLAAAL